MLLVFEIEKLFHKFKFYVLNCKNYVIKIIYIPIMWMPIATETASIYTKS